MRKLENCINYLINVYQLFIDIFIVNEIKK